MPQPVIYVLGFGGGVLVGWLADQYALHLQKRIVIGWAEAFCREAVISDGGPG